LLGILSILVPVAVSLAATILIAAAMAIWGALGLVLSLAMRPFPEWRVSAAAFGLLGLLGLAVLAFPGIGAEILTLFLVAAFLAEGIVSILIGLRLSSETTGWVWMMASGAASLVVGLVVLIGWPGTAMWLLGVLLGLNFLSTGLSLLALRRAIATPAR
jgi:uncharacterized membrane protein HdeD (DUF308 family)